ncbi:hypothetical protein N7452_004243 [Penicillium brevicompactum]|uniref:Uncharacterized protein n=1 Tax=Penicillium brevicompactum TaxID=5074 RepID=A0A9W9UMF2_PENBR|nr:hypothetical protein N7452_004243 [Penicillium brevicompactum]
MNLLELMIKGTSGLSNARVDDDKAASAAEPSAVVAVIIVHARFKRERMLRVALSPISNHAERGNPSFKTSTITPI